MSDFVGTRIKTLRIQRGFSLRKLAQLASIPVGNLFAIENGGRQGINLTLGSGKRLARALGVSLDHLVGMYEAEADEDDAVIHVYNLSSSATYQPGWTSPFIDNTDGALEVLPPRP